MMIAPDTFPAATASSEEHADFLELWVLRSSKRSVSAREYIAALKVASADEAIAASAGDDEPEKSTDQAEAVAEAVFLELDARRLACGGAAYPFSITSNLLRTMEDARRSLYTFLALLSWFGKDAGPADVDAEKVFEEVCAKAAEGYLGGPSDLVRSFVFGFPRRLAPKGFAPALDKLCRAMGEGGGHRKDRDKLPDQKDGKLDLVAWREFLDRRQGKLITFGQCATGSNWESKCSELPPPHDWCTNWMADRPGVWPIRAFFVPHRIEASSWFQACVLGGLLYDRCRIASLVAGLDRGLEAQWSKWSAHVLRRIRRT
jgi:hypothetical protein